MASITLNSDATTTRAHTLKFSGGRLVTVTFTETSTTVYMSIAGPVLREADMPRMRALLAPIVAPYDFDPRPLHIAGQHVTYGATVRHVGPAIAVEVVPHPRGVQ